MAWGAVIQGVSDAANSALGAVFAERASKKAHKRSIAAYQQRYQWTMADMRKAGLNPILAAGTGAGSAPTAPIATRSGGTSDYTSAAMRSTRLKSEMKLLDAQSANQLAGAKKNADQGALAVAQGYQTDQISSQLRELHPHNVNTAAANARIRKAGVPLAELDANFYLEQGGQTARQVQRYLESVGGLSIFKNLIRLPGKGGKGGRPGGRRR